MLKLLTMFKDKGYVQLVCLYDNISQKIENGITDNGGRYLEALVIWLSWLEKHIKL